MKVKSNLRAGLPISAPVRGGGGGGRCSGTSGGVFIA